jgi:hypothetical protein
VIDGHGNLDAKPGDFSYHEVLFALPPKKGKWRIDPAKERRDAT